MARLGRGHDGPKKGSVYQLLPTSCGDVPLRIVDAEDQEQFPIPEGQGT